MLCGIFLLDTSLWLIGRRALLSMPRGFEEAVIAVGGSDTDRSEGNRGALEVAWIEVSRALINMAQQ